LLQDGAHKFLQIVQTDYHPACAVHSVTCAPLHGISDSSAAIPADNNTE